MLRQSPRGDDAGMVSKDIQKPGLDANAVMIPRDTWIFQSRGFINKADEALPTTTDDF